MAPSPLEPSSSTSIPQDSDDIHDPAPEANSTSSFLTHRISILESQLSSSQASKSALERQILSLTQRSQDLVFKLGFESVEEAEEVIGRERDVWERSRVEWSAKRVGELERIVGEKVKGGSSKGRDKGKGKEEGREVDEAEVERLRVENEKMKKVLVTLKAMATKSKPSDIDTNALTTQLHDLQRQYDALLVREKRAERHLDRSENKYETAKRLLERVLYSNGMTDGDKLKISDALKRLDRQGSREVESDVDGNRGALSIVDHGNNEPEDEPLSTNVVNHNRITSTSTPPSPIHSNHTLTPPSPHIPLLNFSPPNAASTPKKRKRVDSSGPSPIVDVTASSHDTSVSLTPFPAISPLSSRSPRTTPRRKRRRTGSVGAGGVDGGVGGRDTDENMGDLMDQADNGLGLNLGVDLDMGMNEESQTQEDSQAPTIFFPSPTSRHHLTMSRPSSPTTPTRSPTRPRITTSTAASALSPSMQRRLGLAPKSPSSPLRHGHGRMSPPRSPRSSPSRRNTPTWTFFPRTLPRQLPGPSTPKAYKFPALLSNIGLSSPRVSREDVEEWGDESTRVESEVVVSPLGSARKGGEKGKEGETGTVSSGSKKRKFDEVEGGRRDGAVVPSKLSGSVKPASSSKSKPASSSKPTTSTKPASSSKPTSSARPPSSSKPSKPPNSSNTFKQPNNPPPSSTPSSKSAPTSAPSSTSAPLTLNARYEINPDANNGLGFAYDEVVRGKHKRSKMCAVDCEDCRAYYQNIGPMPPRAQAPLWRSPTHKPRAHRQEQTATASSSSSTTKTESKGKGKTATATASGSKGKGKAKSNGTSASARVTRSQSRSASQAPHSPLNSFSQLAPSSPSAPSHNHPHNLDPNDPNDANEISTAIQSHLAQISRHRVAWTRPKTPPSYWDIGFPDTQQVGGINERAREMREEGEREVKREAEGGSKEGRWRKRGG